MKNLLTLLQQVLKCGEWKIEPLLPPLQMPKYEGARLFTFLCSSKEKLASEPLGKFSAFIHLFHKYFLLNTYYVPGTVLASSITTIYDLMGLILENTQNNRCSHRNSTGGAPGWLSQLSIQFLVLAQVTIPWVVRSSPLMGSVLSRESAGRFSPSAPPPMCVCSLSLK